MSTEVDFPENGNPTPTSSLDRRSFLRFGGAAALAFSLFTPEEALAVVKAPARRLAILNTHTGERVSVEYWSRGRYVKEGLRAINRVLRDHHSGKVCQMSTHLLDVVHLLHRRVGAHGPIHVVSGYRSPETNAYLSEISDGVARHSFHTQGKAVDLHIPGYSLNKLHRAALALRAGGVGYYPDSHFVHVDVGPRRQWASV